MSPKYRPLRFIYLGVYAGLKSIYKQYGHTKDIDSDVDVFLSGLVLGSDGVASRVGPQTDGDGHDGSGVSGLNLNTQKKYEHD